MNDVSVKEINELYSFNNKINSFVSNMECIRDEVTFYINSEVDRYTSVVDRISYKMDDLKDSMNDINSEISSLYDSLSHLDMDDDYNREYIRNEIDNLQYEYLSIEEEYEDCKDDMYTAQDCMNRLIANKEMVNSLFNRCVSDITTDVNMACNFIDKLVFHLKELQKI